MVFSDRPTRSRNSSFLATRRFIAYQYRGKKVELQEPVPGLGPPDHPGSSPLRCGGFAHPGSTLQLGFPRRLLQFTPRVHHGGHTSLHQLTIPFVSVPLWGWGRARNAVLMPCWSRWKTVSSRSVAVARRARVCFRASGVTRRADSQLPPGPEQKFDTAQVLVFLKQHFESPFWQEKTLRCLGCGACAYTCPTCHCFDIVDEGDCQWRHSGQELGLLPVPAVYAARLGAQPAVRSQPASGSVCSTSSRFTPRNLAEILCTGCGNCTRNCPVGLGVQSVLESRWPRGSFMTNIYKPELMEVVQIRQQTPDVKSVKIRFQDADRAHQFSFRVGQFGIFSVFGYGESTFNICSSSNWKDHLSFASARPAK